MSTIDFRGDSNIREGLGITPVLGERVMIDPSAVVMGDVALGDDVSVWPHANIITQRDITHDDSGGVDHHALAQYRSNTQSFADIAIASKIDGAQAVSPAGFRWRCPPCGGRRSVACAKVVKIMF